MIKLKVTLVLIFALTLLGFVNQRASAQEGLDAQEVQNLIYQLANNQINLNQLTQEQQAAVVQFFQTTPVQIDPQPGQGAAKSDAGVGAASTDDCNTVRADAILYYNLDVLNWRFNIGQFSRRINWCYDFTRITTLNSGDAEVDLKLWTDIFFIKEWRSINNESGGQGQSSYSVSTTVELEICIPVDIPWLPDICVTDETPAYQTTVTSAGRFYTNNGTIQSVGHCWRKTGGWNLLIPEEVTLNVCVAKVQSLASTLPKASDGYAYVWFWQGDQGVENHTVAVNNAGVTWIKGNDGRWKPWNSTGL